MRALREEADRIWDANSASLTLKAKPSPADLLRSIASGSWPCTAVRAVIAVRRMDCCIASTSAHLVLDPLRPVRWRTMQTAAAFCTALDSLIRTLSGCPCYWHVLLVTRLFMAKWLTKTASLSQCELTSRAVDCQLIVFGATALLCLFILVHGAEMQTLSRTTSPLHRVSLPQ